MRIGRFLLTAVITASAFTAMAAPQADKDKMDQFIDNLMGKMTLQEKIGQLNLPVSGEIVTGQAKSSDVAGNIRKGLVGGLFNVKGVENIREVQKIAVEQSRLKIPLLFVWMSFTDMRLFFLFLWHCLVAGIWRLSKNLPV